MRESEKIFTAFFLIFSIFLICSESSFRGKRDAKKLLENLKEQFDINLEFQLRRIGLSGANYKNASSSTNMTKCYGPLGCLEITEDWYGLTRPVNVLPHERKEIDTKFILRTRSTRNHPQFINASDWSINRSKYDSSLPTKIIVHGFLDSAHISWVKEMAEALLDHGDYNVISVDWNQGARAIYSQSAANTRLVGLEVAFLIEFLITQREAKAKDFHLIGHSLGSHISGYAGEALFKKMSQKLGRISGLDPAEPLFQSMPAFVRLDPTDAEFVDAIHTDSRSIIMLGYGMMDPVGHVDFYPNGGMDQPGCALMDFHTNFDSLDTVGRHLVACSHDRVLHYYIDSLRTYNSCRFLGHECSSYENFKQGSCFRCGKDNRHCAVMGMEAIQFKDLLDDRENVKFYLDTGASAPYCRNHYLLELNLGNPDQAERWVQGFLSANLYGSKGELMDINLTPQGSEVFVHGTSVKRLISTDVNLGQVNLVNVEWEYDHDINPLDLSKVCVLLCSDRIYFNNIAITDDSPVVQRRGVVCGNSSESSEEQISEIPSGKSRLFYQPCKVTSENQRKFHRKPKTKQSFFRFPF